MHAKAPQGNVHMSRCVQPRRRIARTEVDMSTLTHEPETKSELRRQQIRVRGEEMLAKVRELVHEGNARRIIVIGDDGTTLLEIPLTAGIVGTVMAPALVAIGAIAALATNYTLLVEARTPPEGKGAEPQARKG